MTEHEMITEMRGILAEVRAIGPCLEGNLLKNKSNKNVKKDGSVSVYAAPPVLQYRAGPGKRRSARVPEGRVAEIERLLAAGKSYRKLMARYTALAAELALSLKKHTRGRHSRPRSWRTSRRCSSACWTPPGNAAPASFPPDSGGLTSASPPPQARIWPRPSRSC